MAPKRKARYLDNPRFPDEEFIPEQDLPDDLYPNPNNLENQKYSQLLADYFLCSTTYLHEHANRVMLEQQASRRDLDTVCAYELYQLKKHFTGTDILELRNFIKHHEPQMWVNQTKLVWDDNKTYLFNKLIVYKHVCTSFYIQIITTKPNYSSASCVFVLLYVK